MATPHGFEKQFLTDEQYVKSGGSQCPHCHGTELTGSSFQAEGGIAWQEVTCYICSAEWTDQYKLIGYADLELDTNQDES